VFMGQRGPLTYSGIYRIVNKHLKEAKVSPPKMGPHRLRHAFGKNYILAGGDTRSLQEIMGHEDISVTEEYVELSRAELMAKHHRFTPLRSVQAATQGSLFPDEETRQAVEEAEKIVKGNS
jgi:integrase/recombinase XerD